MSPFLTLHHPATARRYYEEGLWRDETLYALLARHARERPDQWAARDGRHRLTWKELQGWVDGVAAEFHQQGLSAGDRVSIWMSNRLESIVTFLACSRDGLACNPSLHKSYTCGEIAQLLSRLQTKVLITEPFWGANRASADLDAALESVTSLQRVYQNDDFPAAGVADHAPVDDPDKVVYLAFTSGTTDAPKCVMHSDNTLLANARDLARDWGHDAQTRMLSLSTLSHHIAWVGVGQWLVAGCEFITNDPPPGTSRLDWIIETGATYVLGVPTHAMDILSEQQHRGISRLGSVETFYMAGASIPPSVAEAFVRQGVKPQNVYGMTENSSHQYTHPDDDTTTIITTCGRGGRAYEVRLFDPDDSNREVTAGEVGHIGGRGAALMLGYFNNQTETENSFNAGGWFMSGDLGVLDQAGNLRVVGRLKDLIIRGGHNIYPSHIEALAIRHPQVERAACFPVADERLGERVCIAIVGTIEPEALVEHLIAQGLSKYDLPEYFLRLEDFPMTASGKMLKRELVERTKRGALKPMPIQHRIGKEVGECR